jgi:hypothetical protein
MFYGSSQKKSRQRLIARAKKKVSDKGSQGCLFQKGTPEIPITPEAGMHDRIFVRR